MNSGKLLGVIALILGILIMAFPFAGIFTLSILTGLSILFIGIWLIFLGWAAWDDNRMVSIGFLIVALIALIVGVGVIGNLDAFSFLVGILFYLGGFFLILMGILGLLARDSMLSRGGSILVLLLGIIYLILGLFAFNPIYLAIIIGIGLVFDGIIILLVPSTDMD